MKEDVERRERAQATVIENQAKRLDELETLYKVHPFHSYYLASLSASVPQCSICRGPILVDPVSVGHNVHVTVNCGQRQVPSVIWGALHGIRLLASQCACPLASRMFLAPLLKNLQAQFQLIFCRRRALCGRSSST